MIQIKLYLQQIKKKQSIQSVLNKKNDIYVQSYLIFNIYLLINYHLSRKNNLSILI